jgi:pSer/pThr/pTyr-binding forkhead associated (FHA) protein
MQELTLVLIRFAYLAILWVFVLGAISVIRSDMFGARPDAAAAPGRREQRAQQKQAKQSRKAAKTPKGTPSQVVIVDGPSSGFSVSLEQVPILIGRGSDATIRLDDDYVSTRHARIGRSDDTWYVEDLGSTNGTYIGTHRLTQATAIQLGSKVRVGKTTLELKK